MLSHAVTTPTAFEVAPVIVSPTENAPATETSVGSANAVFLVTRSFTGTVTVGAVEYPVPNWETSTPVTEPIPEVDHATKVALEPRVVTVVGIIVAPLELPVVVTAVNEPTGLAIFIVPGVTTAIVPVTPPAWVTVSPAIKVLEEVSA